jgi:predicted unusual protein kinase regulating ubiquinone biosynthesis (AarF/ABC1/UbiB family)
VEWEEMKKILHKQLGKEKAALLEVDETALASASLGQVHRALNKKTGEELVLKIQYPGLEGAVDGDIKALKTLLSFSKILPRLPNTDEIFDEIRNMLLQELNYHQELKMVEHFGELLCEDRRYIVPKVYPVFSSKRVLAMSYEPGVLVDGPEVAALSVERRNALGMAALELYLKELFQFNLVQTDPHFGNYRIRLDEKKGDQIVLFDFGAVRKIPDSFLSSYKKMLKGVYLSDRALFEEAASELKLLRPGDPEELRNLFYKLCVEITEPFLVDEYDWGQSDLPKRVMQTTTLLATRFPLRAPPKEVVFLDRKMIGMFTFLSVLKVKLPSRAVLGRYLQ